MESKKDMKARGLASPDAADAIAVTFAFPVSLDGGYGSLPAANSRVYAVPTLNYWGKRA